MKEKSDDEVGLLRQLVDKFLRKVTGKLETKKRREIDQIIDLYSSHLGDPLPEMLNLGKDYDNRLELSVKSFRLEYWTSQLKGHFYAETERMVNTMCSYETAKIKSIMNGYTDDPCHLLFYIIKQWMILLSNTHFDLEDLETASKWQKFIRSLIVDGVFEPSKEDNRMQVLFSLEKQLRECIIPKLIQRIEHKCAYDHLKSTQAHLVKLVNHVFKYLFYVARDSEFIANFDYYKLLLIAGQETVEGNIFLTKFERKAWAGLKDTFPIKLLLDLVKDDIPLLTRSAMEMRMSQLEHHENEVQNPFHFRNELEATRFLKFPIDFKAHKYAGHIDLQAYVNVHVYLRELIYFLRGFKYAQYCAEMGGNLLVYGGLGERIIEDIKDCINALDVLYHYCQKIELNAWQAFEDKMYASKDASKSYATDHWVENYSQSATSYFRQLESEYRLAKDVLTQFAAAACKKNICELVAETQFAYESYSSFHKAHSEHRLQLMGQYKNVNKHLDNSQRASVSRESISELGTRQLYNQFCSLVSRGGVDEAKPFFQEIDDRAKISARRPQSSIPDMYIASRMFSKGTDNNENERKLLQEITGKDKNHLKAHYRLAQLYFAKKQYIESKKYCKTAMLLAEEQCDEGMQLKLTKLLSQFPEDLSQKARKHENK